MKATCLICCILALALLGSSCAPEAKSEISSTEVETGVMIKNVGDVACIVFIGSPDGEQQFELAVPERTIEEELEQYKWYRVFRFVVYSVMA